MKKIYSIKHLMLISFMVIAFINGCKKDESTKPPSERFKLLDEKSSVNGNIVEAKPLAASNTFTLAFVNVPANATAKISAEEVNGVYIEETTVRLSGNSVDVALKGTPIADGTFTLMVRVNIDGTVYICSKEFYVDMPNVSEITFGLASAPVFNVNSVTNIEFDVYPKTTELNVVAPANVTVDVLNISPTKRALRVTPNGEFVAGDVVVTASFMALPQISKTVKLTAFSAGAGTEDSPFEIGDAERLNRIQYGLTNAYKLTADIVQAVTTTSGKTFAGILDGNGKKISNCNITAATTDKVGYFSEIAAAGVVKNLVFENLTLTGRDNVGGVAGFNRGTISNVTLKGNITGRNNAGGVAGNNFGTISNCNVTELNVTGDNNVANLAGIVNSGSTQASNVVVVVPTSFPTIVYGVSSAKTVDFIFAPADGTISVKTTPANLTAGVVVGQQKLSLTPAAGFISGDLQLELKKNTLTALRTVKIFSKVEGSVFDGGDGSVGNPYLISTAEGLDFVRSEPAKHYKIIANINLTGPWTPIPTFSGSIDGQGFKVNGLAITSVTANEGWIATNTGTVKNIQFLNVNCTTNSAFGVVAGRNNGGLIQNIIVSGTLTSTNGGDVLGGVVGELASGGKVTQCYTKLTIVASCGMVGGIVGRLTTATGSTAEISFCTSTGSIDINASKTRIAGILGRAEGTLVGGGIIKNCSSSVSITTIATANGIGGIFGADQTAGIVPIDQCMFNGTISGGFSIGGIAGVGSTITNCLVVGQGASQSTPTLRSTGTPATGNVGGIAGTNKVKLINCVVKNVTLKAAATTAAMPVAGIVSTYQNNGYTESSFVANTSLEGSVTAPGSDYIYRIAGTPGNGSGVNAKNYVGPSVSTALRTTAVTDDAAGLDGAVTANTAQSFFQTTLGFNFSVWKTDTDGYPTLQNAGYNGGLQLP